MYKSNKHLPFIRTDIVLGLVFLTVFTFFSCTSEKISSPDLAQAGEISPSRIATAKMASNNITPVYTFSEMEKVGQSKLVRSGNGISFRLHTSNLEPGTVVTLWIVIFNKPVNCVEGCGADDLANPDVGADLQYASGRVIGGSGKITYAGNLNENDNSESILPMWLGLPAPGLIDARKAEIHFIVHSHGPKIPELVNEMLHSFNAGCRPIFDPAFPPVPEELGTYGPNTCRDIQFAVHIP